MLNHYQLAASVGGRLPASAHGRPSSSSERLTPTGSYAERGQRIGRGPYWTLSPSDLQLTTLVPGHPAALSALQADSRPAPAGARPRCARGRQRPFAPSSVDMRSTEVAVFPSSRPRWVGWTGGGMQRPKGGKPPSAPRLARSTGGIAHRSNGRCHSGLESRSDGSASPTSRTSQPWFGSSRSRGSGP